VAIIDIWIQIENHAWDVSPNNIDRMSGQTLQQITGKAPQNVTLTSPVTGVMRNNVTMYRPLSEDALILRRYTPNWAAPDDRKVNPWDLNEPDPTDTGTMGTIPGPVIECNIGDKVMVQLRDMNTRTDGKGPFCPPTSGGTFCTLMVSPLYPFDAGASRPRRGHCQTPHIR